MVPYARRLVALLQEKYSGRRVDVVVVQEGQALRFLLENREALFPGVPVVFTDVTRRSLAGLRLPPDVTGAFLVLEGQRTVRVALDLHPEARRVVLVAGSSPADQAFEALRPEARRGPEPRHGDRSRSAAFRSTSSSGGCRALPRDSVVIFVSYRADSLGRSMVSRDVLRRVARASSAPVYGAARRYGSALGIVGGDLIDFRALGARTALLTSRILRGESPAAIPPIESPSAACSSTGGELRRWGIDEARLPEGSVVLFRETTLWSEHGRAILGAFALLVAQIAPDRGPARRAAAAHRRPGRASARRSSATATVADFTHDWEYWRLPDETFAYVSPSCLRLTGYEAAEFHRRPSLLNEIVVPEDRPRWDAHGRLALAGSGRRRGLEFRIRRADGQVRWIEHVCPPVNGQDGRFLGLRGSNRDVTEKKRSEEAAARGPRRDPARCASGSRPTTSTSGSRSSSSRVRGHRRPAATRCATFSRGSSRWRRPRARSCSRGRPASARSSSPARSTT